MGASSNVHGLLTVHSKHNRIIALDFLGPLKMNRTIYTYDEKKKAKMPTLPKTFQSIKFWLSIKVCVLTNILDVSIVIELSTSALILDLKIFMSKLIVVQIFSQ